MKKRKILFGIFLMLFSVSAVSVLGGGGTREAEGDTVLPSVRVEKASELTESEAKTYVGTVSASKTVDIVARISGVLWEAAFKEGSLVKKGDLLFRIEDTIYRENVNIARATLKQTQAELDYATREKVRYEQLYQTNATAQTTYENALRSYQVYLGKLDEANADLVLAQNDLSYTVIQSPLNGRIGRNIYSEGNYITPEKGTLATIVQFDPVNIRFAMSESDFFRHSRNGQLASDGLEILRADGEPYKGRVEVDFIDNQIDSKTGTIMIQLVGENPEMELIPGGYVMVKFREKFQQALPSVSVTALMTDGEHHYVYVVIPENKVERRDVVIGPQVKARQGILSGLQVGETVVIAGINKIKPGEKVNPVFAGEGLR